MRELLPLCLVVAACGGPTPIHETPPALAQPGLHVPEVEIALGPTARSVAPPPLLGSPRRPPLPEPRRRPEPLVPPAFFAPCRELPDVAAFYECACRVLCDHIFAAPPRGGVTEVRYPYTGTDGFAYVVGPDGRARVCSHRLREERFELRCR